MRRVIPTRVAPIAFFVREDADWMRPHHPGAEDSGSSFLSPMAQALLELLKQRGALFFPDMVRATGKLKAEVETGLWELVAAGLSQPMDSRICEHWLRRRISAAAQA